MYALFCFVWLATLAFRDVGQLPVGEEAMCNRIVQSPQPNGGVEPVLMPWTQRCDSSISVPLDSCLGLVDFGNLVSIISGVVALVVFVVFIASCFLGDDLVHLVRVALQNFRARSWWHLFQLAG